MPLHKRIPKRGFTPYTKKNVTEVNLAALNRLVVSGVIKAGEFLDEAKLGGLGLVRKGNVVKVLGFGMLKVPLQLYVGMVSEGATRKIRAAGGNVMTYLNSDSPKNTGIESALLATRVDGRHNGGVMGDFRYDIFIGVVNGVAKVGINIYLDPDKREFWRENGRRFYFQLATRDTAIETRILTVEQILELEESGVHKLALSSGSITGRHPEVLVDLFADGRPIHNSATPIQ